MILLAADHAGYQYKEYVREQLENRTIAFEDLGAYALKEGDDFTGYAKRVAKEVAKGTDKGILLCGSGHGMCIAANRYQGVRAVNGWNNEAARRAREEDDANILCLPCRLITKDEAWQITSVFLSTTFTHEDRYKRRIKQIDEK